MNGSTSRTSVLLPSHPHTHTRLHNTNTANTNTETTNTTNTEMDVDVKQSTKRKANDDGNPLLNAAKRSKKEVRPTIFYSSFCLCWTDL